MNRKLIASIVLLASLLATTPAVAAEGAVDAEDAGEAVREARLEDAQARLEAAAREIAELTAELVDGVAVHVVEGVGHAMRRAMLGLNVGNVGDADDRADGVLVMGVTPGGPGDEAGLRSGDVLVRLGDTELAWQGDTSPMQRLQDVMADVEPGSELDFSYRRDGREASGTVTPQSLSEFAFSFDKPLVAPHAPMAPHAAPEAFVFRHLFGEDWSDMELVELTPELGDYFGTEEGVLVVRAPRQDTLGLKDGDVILDIGGRKPASPGHVIRILRSYEPGEEVALTIVRKGRREVLDVELPEADRSARLLPAPAQAPAPSRPPDRT